MAKRLLMVMVGTPALAAPAVAQQNTRSETDLWGVTNCQTTGQPGGGGIDWGLLGKPVDVGTSVREGSRAS